MAQCYVRMSLWSDCFANFWLAIVAVALLYTHYLSLTLYTIAFVTTIPGVVDLSIA